MRFGQVRAPGPLRRTFIHLRPAVMMKTTNPQSVSRTARLVLLPAMLVGASAAAQQPAWTDRDDPAGCTAKIPESAMSRVAIYASPVVATPSDTGRSRIALGYASDVTAAVATGIRRMLGSAGREIPDGDSVVGWRGARTTFRVVAHRQNGLSWRTIPDDSVTPDRRGDALLARALALHRDSNPAIPWPKNLRDATIAFDITLNGIMLDRNEVGLAPPMTDPQPAFSVMQPWMEPARELRRRPVNYPMRSADGLAGGFLILRFQVDTTGRVDMKSVGDVWPEDRPRLRGELGDFYRSFLAAVRRPLEDAEFTPARIGGCAVKSWVVETHDFRIIYRQ